MKILVTGGAGFIGSTVSRFVKTVLDWDLVVVDKLTYAGHQSSLAPIANRPGYVFVRADICDGKAMSEVLARHRPESVVHLAAETHVDRSIDLARGFIETNIVGTFTLLEAAREHWKTLPSAARERFRFLHVSTDEVYGSLGREGLFTEDTRCDPHSPYSATKAASDHLVKAWGHTYGLPVIVSHCSNNYGPYQLPEKLIPLSILNGLEGLAIPVYGDGGNIRDWLHVEDHAEALVLMLMKGAPGETYNVGGRNERTNISVVEKICDLLDGAVPSPAPRRSLDSLRRGQARSRPALCDRRDKAGDAAGLAPEARLCRGLEANRGVVPRERRMVAAVAQGWRRKAAVGSS